jgi:UDP-N-acetyl-D-mannosaminuronate dehydrogenase
MTEAQMLQWILGAVTVMAAAMFSHLYKKQENFDNRLIEMQTALTAEIRREIHNIWAELRDIKIATARQLEAAQAHRELVLTTLARMATKDDLGVIRSRREQ